MVASVVAGWSLVALRQSGTGAKAGHLSTAISTHVFIMLYSQLRLFTLTLRTERRPALTNVPLARQLVRRRLSQRGQQARIQQSDIQDVPGSFPFNMSFEHIGKRRVNSPNVSA